jgi:hypothetical protein
VNAVGRTQGANGKKKNGIKLAMGIGLPPMDGKEVENKQKMPKPGGRTSTQGAKPSNRVPNSMRKTRIPKL